MVQKLISRSQDFLSRKNTSILSAALIIGLSFLGSALLGLIRNRLLASHFFGGSEGILDIYFAAFLVPDTIFQLLVVGSVSASFIPLYQEKSADSDQKANVFANSALVLINLAIILTSLAISIFAYPISNLLTHFDHEKLTIMTNLIRLMSIAQVVFATSSILTGVLQARKVFLVPSLAPILYNLGTILGVVLLADKFGIYGVAYGVILGSLLHAAVQIPTAYRLGFRFSPFLFDIKSGVVEMIKLMPARTLSLSLDQVQRWIAVNLASLLSSGSLTVFTFARQLYVLPISLFGISLSQATFPSLAQSALESDKTQFKQILSKSIMQIFFFALPASILILVLRVPLVRIAFGAKSFPWDATLDTGRALALLALSIAPQSVNHTLTRSLYSLKDTKTPLVVGLASTALFLLLSTVFSRALGLGILGICLALTLSNLADFAFLYWKIVRKVGSLGLTVKLSKIVLIGVFTAFSLWGPMRLLDKFVFDTTRTIPLIVLTIIVSAVGFGVYYIFCSLFKVEEIDEVNHIFKKLGNWRKILASSDELIDPR